MRREEVGYGECGGGAWGLMRWGMESEVVEYENVRGGAWGMASEVVGYKKKRGGTWGVRRWVNNSEEVGHGE